MLFPARYYALLLPLLHAEGLDPKALLDGLDPQQLLRPAAQLTASQVEALVVAVLRHDRGQQLALRLGQQIKPSSHETLGLAMMSASTLNEALQLAVRYWPLITPLFNLSAERSGPRLLLHWQTTIPLRNDVLRFHAEALLAALHAELRFLLGGSAPAYRVELPRLWLRADYRVLRPVSIHPHDEAPDRFQASLPIAMLEQPLALADPGARAAAERRCQELLERLDAEGGLTGWVLQILQRAQDCMPRQSEVAALLHLSSRSLHRKLSAEGTSFRELGKHERFRRAGERLARTAEPVSSIALALGYRDSANFSRAFRQHAGVAPTVYRRLAQESD
jgi:AraC-like DNA-binding protein